MRLTALKTATGVLAATLALSACQAVGPTATSPSVSPTPKPRAEIEAVKPSPQSEKLTEYYASIQRTLLIQDMLRTGGGGPDVPFSDEQLMRNFEKIAFFQEYNPNSARFVNSEQKIHLTRWSDPIRVALHFGRSVSQEKRVKDRKTLARYVRRLSQITGHPISMNSANPNFNVYVINEDERMLFGPEFRRAQPGSGPIGERAIRNMPRDIHCLVFASDPGNTGQLKRGIAIIRAELPDLMRSACFHEELAQGLGLSNDSPRARPSIFNDDDEFALLTTHDEFLLRMLYDKRLRPGMSAEQARPIIRQITAELVGGSV